MTLKQTPSQTVGPYFAYGLTSEQYGYDFASIAGSDLASDDTHGERIRIEGRVLDGAGDPVNDAMIEIWQADAMGRYAHPADGRTSNETFTGFGRTGTGTDPENRFIFNTIKPGTVDDEQAPHINVIVFMRGILSHAYTRLYFADEEESNATDPVFSTIPADRQHTVVANREDRHGETVYRFDIHMQGEAETIFFDV